MATSTTNFGRTDDADKRSAFSDFSDRLDRLVLSGDTEIVGAYISNSLEKLDPSNNPVSPDIETMIDQDTEYASRNIASSATCSRGYPNEHKIERNDHVEGHFGTRW